MNYTSSLDLTDMQKTPDTRGVEIDQVGICDLLYPIVVLDRENQRQGATAEDHDVREPAPTISRART